MSSNEAGAPGVRVVEWPRQRELVAGTRSIGCPILIVVDDDAEPPTTQDCCQDWMWRSGGQQELRIRLHQLALKALLHRRAHPTLDEFGTLRLGLRTAQLPPKERMIATLLLERFGHPVHHDELVMAGWPNGVSGPNVIASRISALRSRVRWLGLEIHGTAGSGYCLEVSEPGGSDPARGAEDILDGDVPGAEPWLTRKPTRRSGRRSSSP